MRVENGGFVLKGRPWHPIGANYWPLYFPPYELNIYFRGWLDKGAYDPVLVEEDFAALAKSGINLLLTRLEANHLERIAPQLRHVLLLCQRYGMKLGLAVPNWTCPLYYNGKEFRRLLDECGLVNNPDLFCYDIAWEFGHRYLPTSYRHLWDGDWHAWIEARYGSIANAEANWGFPANRKADGSITCPDDRQIGNEGQIPENAPWTKMVAAYRRFADDRLSRLFNDAISDMREAAPNHLISFRQGRLTRYDVSHSAALYKKLDFTMPEAYHIEMDGEGENVLGFEEIYTKFLSGGKPDLWVEFGKSSCGNTYFNTNRWDHEHCRPFPEDARFAAAYMDFICAALVRVGATGFAPWMWPGGRRVHERSDYGLVGLDGVLRETGEAFLKHARQGAQGPRRKPAAAHWLTVDSEAHPEGIYHLCFGPGKVAYSQHGETLGVKTEATGKTSSNVPRIAVGNVPWNGSNPHKFLNSEFNFFKVDSVKIANGASVKIRQSGTIRASIGVGNLHEVEWLERDICLTCSNGQKFPLPKPVGAYGDVVFDASLILPTSSGNRLHFRMGTSEGFGFGESFTIVFQ